MCRINQTSIKMRVFFEKNEIVYRTHSKNKIFFLNLWCFLWVELFLKFVIFWQIFPFFQKWAIFSKEFQLLIFFDLFFFLILKTTFIFYFWLLLHFCKFFFSLKNSSFFFKKFNFYKIFILSNWDSSVEKYFNYILMILISFSKKQLLNSIFFLSVFHSFKHEPILSIES